MDEITVIRNATAGDIAILARFLSELFSIEDDFSADIDNQKRGLKMLIDDPFRSAVFIAEAGSVPAGMVTGQLVVSTAAGGYSVILEDMFVTGRFRGCGVGSKLFNAVVSWGRANGAVRVQLLYDTRNRDAKSFYIGKKMAPGNMAGLYGKIPR